MAAAPSTGLPSPLPITSQPVRDSIDAIRLELRDQLGRKVTYNEVAERLVAAYRQQYPANQESRADDQVQR